MCAQSSRINEQLAVVQRLADCSLLQAELYAAYAQKYPRAAAFWQVMAEQAHGHADALAAVREVVQPGRELFEVDRYPVERVEIMNEWLTNALKEALRGKITLKKALERAMASEKALIGAGFYDETHAAGPVFHELVHQLTHDARDHIKRLQEALELLEHHRRCA